MHKQSVNNLDQYSLQVTEIYQSIQGEAAYAGCPCTFVRLTGCPLRCRWCDTVYSFHGGETMAKEQVLRRVDELGLKLVEITGGEPLAQPGTLGLIAALVEQGYKVLIETSGAESLAGLHPQTHIIMDLKCPHSGMMDKNRFDNIDFLKRTDEVKFVIAHRDDFDWALMMMAEYQLEKRCQVLFSPAFGLVQPRDLAAWMLNKKVNAKLNMQLHKYIWSPRAKGV